MIWSFNHTSKLLQLYFLNWIFLNFCSIKNVSLKKPVSGFSKLFLCKAVWHAQDYLIGCHDIWKNLIKEWKNKWKTDQHNFLSLLAVREGPGVLRRGHSWNVHIQKSKSSALNPVPKPNSWTHNFVEVSGHNLESSQTWRLCMDFLNHREGGTCMVFNQVFLFLFYSVP